MFQSLWFKKLLALSYSLNLKHFISKDVNEDTEDFDLCGLGVQVNTVPEIAEMIIKSNDLFSSYVDLFIESY